MNEPVRKELSLQRKAIQLANETGRPVRAGGSVYLPADNNGVSTICHPSHKFDNELSLSHYDTI